MATLNLPKAKHMKSLGFNSAAALGFFQARLYTLPLGGSGDLV